MNTIQQIVERAASNRLYSQETETRLNTGYKPENKHKMLHAFSHNNSKL